MLNSLGCLNLNFKVEIAGIIAVSGGGDKVYSATKKWNQYKETWKLTGTLKHTTQLVI
ncbi:hypothetical protein LAV79_12590 [Peribacillus butanolivorans]|uniref:hypothetical protein n=1 Tax=Peribacillus butanolivorans TaxID=421767 RepID=UPI0030C9BCBB